MEHQLKARKGEKRVRGRMNETKRQREREKESVIVRGTNEIDGKKKKKRETIITLSSQTERASRYEERNSIKKTKVGSKEERGDTFAERRGRGLERVVVVVRVQG